MVVAIVGVLAGVGVPLSTGMIDDFKSRGDAQALSAAVAQTKLTSAAKFTDARLFVNLTTNGYRIQILDKATNLWVNASDQILLTDRSQFGFGSVTAPPPNTVATLTQAPNCLDDAGVAIVGTACLIFNSRGVSVTAAGPPATTQGLFMNGTSGTFAVILGAAGQLQVWRTTQAGASAWKQQ